MPLLLSLLPGSLSAADTAAAAAAVVASAVCPDGVVVSRAASSTQVSAWLLMLLLLLACRLATIGQPAALLCSLVYAACCIHRQPIGTPIDGSWLMLFIGQLPKLRKEGSLVPQCAGNMTDRTTHLGL
jgi:hypothetical protein